LFLKQALLPIIRRPWRMMLLTVFRPRLQNFWDKSSYMKFHKLCVPSRVAPIIIGPQ